jgi:hypothetical protein
MQSGLQDDLPGVMALHLHSLSTLCEEDVVDFYTGEPDRHLGTCKVFPRDSHSTEAATGMHFVVVVVIAWRVVRKLVPKLPEDAEAACAWLRLLGCGGLDARLNEPVAAPLLELLWQASEASSPQVRAAAHDALLSFGVETIDELLPTALARYAALHLRELEDDSSEAVAATASLLEAALAVEHARRRRNAARPVVVAAAAAPATGGEVSTAAAAAAAPTPKAVDLMHSVASMVRRLCHGGANSAGARRALAPSLLVCYVPQPATSQQQPSARASARAAAAAYAAAFEDATSQAAGVAWNHFLLVRTPAYIFARRGLTRLVLLAASVASFDLR